MSLRVPFEAWVANSRIRIKMPFTSLTAPSAVRIWSMAFSALRTPAVNPPISPRIPSDTIRCTGVIPATGNAGSGGKTLYMNTPLPIDAR